ncbi:unnamed protein product [Ilex paraguariensis]|uniref:Uncharacterized protein n=1 Tax=Ilex paraguariensis TaxID=185542 RepID=A0ABC8UMN4_9AQUA
MASCGEEGLPDTASFMKLALEQVMDAPFLFDIFPRQPSQSAEQLVSILFPPIYSSFSSSLPSPSILCFRQPSQSAEQLVGALRSAFVAARSSSTLGGHIL